MNSVLELLRENARLTPAEIAARIGLTQTDVEETIDRLEMEGYILGYTVIVDTDKLRGQQGVTAFIEVKISPDSGGFDRMAHRISQYDQVRSCFLMSGGYDLAVVVEGADLYEVATFVAEKLAPLAGVLSTATHFQLRTYKRDGHQLNPPTDRERLPVSP